MSVSREQEMRALLAFYVEAGVDALMVESPINRLAELPATQPSQFGTKTSTSRRAQSKRRAANSEAPATAQPSAGGGYCTGVG